MSESELKQKIQDLHQQLIMMEFEYDDLLKKLEKWGKEFRKLWKESNDELEG